MIKICIFYNKDLHNTPSFTVVAATVRPLLGGAAPFSSRHRRATFPAIGKVYPTKLGRAERAKVGVGVVCRRDGARKVQTTCRLFPLLAVLGLRVVQGKLKMED